MKFLQKKKKKFSKQNDKLNIYFIFLFYLLEYIYINFLEIDEIIILYIFFKLYDTEVISYYLKYIVNLLNILQIVIDIQHRPDDYDSCNALVLPTKKKKVKNIDKKVRTQLLSKKRRKQLEKVIEKKKKKLQVLNSSMYIV